MKKIWVYFLMVLAVSVSGCGKSSPEIAPASGQSAEVSTTTSSGGTKTVNPATVGTIRGKIIFEGQVPQPRQIPVKGNPECATLHEGGVIASEEVVVKDNILQNVFVYVKKGLEDYTFTAPAEPHVIENKKCVYVPHVSGVMVGQEVTFLNGDSTLHNIHAYPKESKSFNLGLPLVGMKQTKKFTAPEIMVSMKCDVHPWMLGYVGVLTHPYFQVSAADGSFELKNLPPGEYVIEAWHEKFGIQSQSVTLGAQETKDIEFKFTP